MNDWEMSKALIAASTERFAHETAGHTMTVLHDDGLYRHLRFRDPKNPFYWFELITTPHALVFRGDGESFVFSRVEDMFDWFRRSGRSGIQPDYWSQKLESDRDSAKEYAQERLDKEVTDYLADSEDDFPGVTAAWTEATEGFTAEYNTEYEETARQALQDFEFGELTVKVSCSCQDGIGPTDETRAIVWRSRHEKAYDSSHRLTVERFEPFTFEDTGEWQLHDFGWWFLWACHAIVWGIAQYDAAKTAAVETPAAPEQAPTVTQLVRPGVREFVETVTEASGQAESCWVVPSPKRWALFVPRKDGLLGGSPSRQRRTVDDAVALGLIRLGPLEPLPAHRGAPTWLLRRVPQPLQGHRITVPGGAQ